MHRRRCGGLCATQPRVNRLLPEVGHLLIERLLFSLHGLLLGMTVWVTGELMLAATEAKRRVKGAE